MTLPTDIAARLRHIDDAVEDAYSQAAGIAVNSEDHPAILAVWMGNRLVRFEIDPSVIEYYRQRERHGHPEALTDFNNLVNGVIRKGREDFLLDLSERLDGLT